MQLGVCSQPRGHSFRFVTLGTQRSITASLWNKIHTYYIKGKGKILGLTEFTWLNGTHTEMLL